MDSLTFLVEMFQEFQKRGYDLTTKYIFKKIEAYQLSQTNEKGYFNTFAKYKHSEKLSNKTAFLAPVETRHALSLHRMQIWRRYYYLDFRKKYNQTKKPLDLFILIAYSLYSQSFFALKNKFLNLIKSKKTLCQTLFLNSVVKNQPE